MSESESHTHSHNPPGHARNSSSSTTIQLKPSPLITSTSTFPSSTPGKKSADETTELSLSLIRQPVVMVQTMLAHSDTRSIFLFLVLNFTFMLVQFIYSILSHSLGLLSDSIHMLLDCVALLVGLLASVMAKWPPSASFPYGLGKVESLSGFINGILLVGISAGIVVEAVERIWRPVAIERVTELLIVSLLGLIVNLVGIVAFNHGHVGHGHSHSHSHSHSEPSSHTHSTPHSHSEISSRSHSTPHAHSHDHHDHHDSHDSKSSDNIFSTPSTDDNDKPIIPPSSTFSCAEDHNIAKDKMPQTHNENMHGLFLHILADTLGSVGVIVSTLLTSYFGWPGFDPLASLFIAVLIFISAIPLVTSSANSLLLSLTLEQEYVLRDALNDVISVPGVVGYSHPRFWSTDGGTSGAVRGIIHVQISDEADPAVVRQKVEARLCSALTGDTDLFIQVERASIAAKQ
ncbi:cation efflux protein [Lipomyces orientalis]|uniref:Cation efflux protein n=1 Tax=Lipomyces orientalis TaxID=1233043 RepID=A0ACC3TP04_9ASCO